MANTRSAEKRNRQTQKRRVRNAAVKSNVKNAVKKAREALGGKDAGTVGASVKDAVRMLGKAASKGVLHKRTASRRIARLAKQATAKTASK